MQEVSGDIFSLWKKSKIVLLPPNFISWLRTEICCTLFHYPRLTSEGRPGVMWEVSHDVFSLQNKSNIILLPPNFISWQLKPSTENLTLQKGWFSRSANTMNQNFDFSHRSRKKASCVSREINHLMYNERYWLLKKKLVILTKITNSESAPVMINFVKTGA